MAAGNYDFTIDQGSDFTLAITVKDSNDAATDLTGYSARAQLRPERASTTLTASFTCTVTDATGGKIDMTLGNATSKTIEAGTYFYDLEIFTANDAIVRRIIQGKAKVTQEVTR